MTIQPAGMRAKEYDRLRELLSDAKPVNTLEIGMANGGSSVVICESLRSLGGKRLHTAIDPFQTDKAGWDSQGLKLVESYGLSPWLEFVEDFDYLALPQMVRDHRKFDFVLIDGWHSFDFTLLDLFYSDLLLKDGGILVIHDTGWPSVYRACRFLETHKSYTRIGPPISVHRRSVLNRACRRVSQLLMGPHHYREAANRRTQWFSLGAYRKMESSQVDNSFYKDF